MDDDFDRTIAEVHNLTPYERQALRSVKQRQKLFEMEESAHLRQTVEGVLLKFTNVVKGFQPRWFVLNADTGTLEYFEKEEFRRQGQKARGELQLTFATVVPSEEDSCTFSVNANNGDVFRVKATDARERQYWVDRIRAVAQYFSEQCKILGSYNPVSLPDIYSCPGRSSSGSASSSAGAVAVAAAAASASASTSAAVASLAELASQQQQQQQHQQPPASLHLTQQQQQPAVQRHRRQQQRRQNGGSGVGGGVGYPSPDGLLASLRDAVAIFDDLVAALPPPSPAAFVASGKDASLHSGASQTDGDIVGNAGGADDRRLSGENVDVVDGAEFVEAAGEGEGEGDCSLELGEDAATSQFANGEEVQTATATATATPVSSPSPNYLDRDLLIARGTAAGALRALEACLDLLPLVQPQTVVAAPVSIVGLSAASQTDGRGDVRRASAGGPVCVGDSISFAAIVPLVEMLENPALPVPHQDDQPDSTIDSDSLNEQQQQPPEAAQEEHKSVILHLLQQLKLGMDLTRVVLPTFILERRSLLEMFADFMLHPASLLRAADQPDPESRITAVLEWYLTGFHGGRRGATAKKPYNPLIGETFHCSWRVPTDSGEDCLISYTAEQVSHHPPVTAFYLECPQKQIWLNASIYTKSKFMGMSIGVNLIGRLELHLMRHDEVYHITLPSAYARSILTVPWVELGDKVSIACSKTRYNASVVFHTKPFYGGRLHRVSAEVRNPASSVVCRVSGEWNGQLEFDFNTEREKRQIDVSCLPTAPKLVSPIGLQRAYESRRLWAPVTEALRLNDIQKATEEKRKLEERQRHCEKLRRERGIEFPVKYFVRDSDEDSSSSSSSSSSWLFKRPLQRGQTHTNA